MSKYLNSAWIESSLLTTVRRVVFFCILSVVIPLEVTAYVEEDLADEVFVRQPFFLQVDVACRSAGVRPLHMNSPICPDCVNALGAIAPPSVDGGRIELRTSAGHELSREFVLTG